MWDWAIWGALIVGGLAVTGSLVLLAVRALQAWRDVRRVRRHLFRALDDLTAAGERAAEAAAEATDTTELSRSLRRLQRALAQLAILREAIDEVQSVFRFASVFASRS